jgi:hypothetical protein
MTVYSARLRVDSDGCHPPTGLKAAWFHCGNVFPVELEFASTSSGPLRSTGTRSVVTEEASVSMKWAVTRP